MPDRAGRNHSGRRSSHAQLVACLICHRNIERKKKKKKGKKETRFGITINTGLKMLKCGILAFFETKNLLAFEIH